MKNVPKTIFGAGDFISIFNVKPHTKVNFVHKLSN